MFIKLNEDKTADKSRAETAQVLVSQCTELQTEVGLYDRVLLSEGDVGETTSCCCTTGFILSCLQLVITSNSSNRSQTTKLSKSLNLV